MRGAAPAIAGVLAFTLVVGAGAAVLVTIAVIEMCDDLF